MVPVLSNTVRRARVSTFCDFTTNQIQTHTSLHFCHFCHTPNVSSTLPFLQPCPTALGEALYAAKHAPHSYARMQAVAGGKRHAITLVNGYRRVRGIAHPPPRQNQRASSTLPPRPPLLDNTAGGAENTRYSCSRCDPFVYLLLPPGDHATRYLVTHLHLSLISTSIAEVYRDCLLSRGSARGAGADYDLLPYWFVTYCVGKLVNVITEHGGFIA